MENGLYLEDLHIGQVFVSGSAAMEADAMIAFAAEFDPQPFHLDEVAARASLFGGLAASGWYTAARSMRLLQDSVKIAGGMIGAGVELAWPMPTRPGDVIRVETTVTEIRPSRSRPDRGMASLSSRTLNQRDEVVQTMAAKIVVLRKEVGEGATREEVGR